MTDTTTKFSPGFWNQSHPLAAKQLELFNKLVPPMGEATTPHGEVLRAATRIYYDVYNNGLGNGPFVDEVTTLRRFQAELTTRMEQPQTFSDLMRAVAPPGAEWGDLHIRDLSTWPHAPALEDLMAATVQYADERVSAFEAEGRLAGATTLLPTGHALAPAEAALADRHLSGRRAQSLAGELFRGMRRVAQALEVKGMVTPEFRYELTLLSKFAPELDVDAASLNMVCSTLDYHMESGTPVPPMDSWMHAASFALVCEAVVRLADHADSTRNEAL
jgi:hypothetical protein